MAGLSTAARRVRTQLNAYNHDPRIVSVLDYGADPTGVRDSSSAINAAIAALPATGGIVYLPPGTYISNSSISIGDGSTGSDSTRWGVILQGASPAGIYPLNGPSMSRTILRRSSGTGVMVNIFGPLNGWGIRDIEIDGNGLATTGLQEVSACGGDCRNVIVRNCTTAQQFVTAIDPTGGLVGLPRNHMHNKYTGFTLGVPTDVNTATGLLVGSGGAGTQNNCCFDTWEQLAIYAGTSPGAGVTQYGIQLRAADNEVFRDVEFVHFNNANGGTGVAVRFIYTSGFTGCPADCLIEQVDFAPGGSGATAFQNSGSPTGNNTMNRIRNIGRLNGYTPNPLLVNLEWEGVRTKASAPVATDQAQGTGGIWKNTTSGAVAYWFNDAGVMRSVALT